MANQGNAPQPGDVADEHGKFGSGEEIMGPDPVVDASATRGTGEAAGSTRRVGTQGAAIEDAADPDADANRPDLSKPIAMGAGTTGPDRGRDIPGGGYGDSRDVSNSGDAGDRGTDVVRDDEPKAPPGAPIENPAVGQPANVTQPRRP